MNLKISWKPKEYHPKEISPSVGPLKGVTWMIDGTECKIAEPTDEDYSHILQSGKSGLYGIKYEVVCQVSSGRIMWVSGGGSAAEHDRNLLDAGGLLDMIPKGEIGIGDKGYLRNDLKSRILTPIPPRRVQGQHILTAEEILYNELLSSLRIEIERVFGRMKKCFAYLTHSRDRDLLTHRENFTVLANTFNIMLEFNPMRATAHSNLTNPPANLRKPPTAR